MSAKRSKTRERKLARDQQRRRSRQYLMVIGVIVVVAAFAGLFLISNLPTEAPIPDDLVARYDDYLQGVTTEGFPILGNPDAPVSVVEYSSFSCPGCENFHRNVFPDLLPRIRAGEISFTYVPLQTGSIQNPQGAAKTALCAGEQGEFWEMHDLLFEWQVTFGNTAFTSNRLVGGIEAMGLDVGEFNSCFNSSRMNEVLGDARVEQSKKEIASTPTIQVNNTTVGSTIEEINAQVDQLLPSGVLEPGVILPDEVEAQPTEEEVLEITPDVDEISAEGTQEATDTAEATEDSATDSEGG